MRNICSFFVLLLALVLTSCMTNRKNDGLNNDVPIISDLVITPNRSTSAGTKNLKVGQPYYGVATCYDSGFNVASITITQTRESDNYTIGPTEIPFYGIQTDEIFTPCIQIIPEMKGNWDISVYVTDVLGNKSSTKTLTAYVTE